MPPVVGGGGAGVGVGVGVGTHATCAWALARQDKPMTTAGAPKSHWRRCIQKPWDWHGPRWTQKRNTCPQMSHRQSSVLGTKYSATGRILKSLWWFTPLRTLPYGHRKPCG